MARNNVTVIEHFHFFPRGQRGWDLRPVDQKTQADAMREFVTPDLWLWRRHKEVLNLIKRNVKRGQIVGVELTPEQLESIGRRDERKEGFPENIRVAEKVYVRLMRSLGAHVIPLEDPRRHAMALRLREKLGRRSAGKVSYEQLFANNAIVRSASHAINAIRNQCDAVLLADPHGYHVAELLKGAGIPVVYHPVSVMDQTFRPADEERKLRVLGSFVKKAVSSGSE